MAASMPRIGITCCLDQHRRESGREDLRLRLNMWYAEAVLAAGGMPVPLVPTSDNQVIREQLDYIDGLLVTGGPDVSPARYGQQPHPKTVTVCPRRDGYDFAAFHEADRRQIPILGICLGCQIINVARGGSLIQHLDDVPRTPPIIHTDGVDYVPHDVCIERNSLLHRIIPQDRTQANSSHHQGLDRIGKNLRIVARAPDGVIEAVEDPDRRFLLAVQWHPEVITHLPQHAALFEALVVAAKKAR